tara:strand:+ start:1266 stop:1733 length:468 start_codon:yes stop_codon:yes gene_type:complete
MKYLITGGCGFLGSNISERLIHEKYEVFIIDNLSRFGSYENYNWLKTRGKFTFYQIDIRNTYEVEKIIKEIKPDLIYHLAGQVAMTTSIENPRTDFEINTIGTFNLLNVVRMYSPGTSIIYSSTNKVYGDLENLNYLENELRYTCVEYPDGFDEL